MFNSRFLKVIVVLSVIITLLAACSVQKRRYLKGWYVCKEQNASIGNINNKDNKKEHEPLAAISKQQIINKSLTNKKHTPVDQLLASGSTLPAKNYKYKPPSDTLKKVKKKNILFRHLNLSYDPEKKEIESPKTTIDKPLLPLLLLALGIAFLVLAIVMLANFGITFYLLSLFVSGLNLLLSLFVSVDFKKRIDNYHLDRGKALYNLIIFLAVLFGLVCAFGFLLTIGYGGI